MQRIHLAKEIEMTVLLFDIDNTLLDFDKAEYDALGKIFAHYQIEDNQENRATYSRENKALWRLHESEKLSQMCIRDSALTLLEIIIFKQSN